MKNFVIILNIYLFGLLLILTNVHANPFVVQKSNFINNYENKEPWDMLEALGASQMIKSFNGTWISGNEILYQSSSTDYRIFNTTTKNDTLFVPRKDLIKWKNGQFTLFPDKKKFLVRYASKSVFRHSMVAKYDVYDIETKISFNIGDNKHLQYCNFSPIGNRIVYVFDNNVFIRQPDGKEYQLTQDGEIGKIYNGIPDWVYEEEVLSTGSALWWSADGEKLAMGYFNDTNVRTYKYFLYGDPADLDYQYPKEMDLKYPKPGTPNPNVLLKIANINNINSDNSTKWEILKAPEDIVTKDHIMNSVTWSDTEHIVVTWMNRRQNHGIIMLCNLNGKCEKILSMDEPKGWLLPTTPVCFDDGKSCTMINWIDNWLQAWNFDIETGENQWKSLGDFTVLKIYGFNQVTKNLYFQGTLLNDSTQHHVYKNKKCISCTIKDIDGTNCKQASGTFSKDLSFYTITCSGPNPSYTKIFNSNDDEEIYSWEINSIFRDFLQTKLMPNIKYLKTTVSDGYLATIKLHLPPTLDWNNPPKDKKYPLIIDVYGGPNSVRINNALSIGWSAYLVTQRNVIYAEIESRGSGNKGKELLMSVNNHLGDYEVQDQITITNYLHKNYNLFDNERSGIWGWSYGGYVTAMTMAKDYNRVFQCGISVAPVTSWTFYDSIYTERYMGLPTKDDNIENYIKSDVTENIKNFRNHDFLLIHGVADDNVHIQHSMTLSKALQRADILFEEMYYPDENHGIGNLRQHLYHTMDQFWINCLNLETADE